MKENSAKKALIGLLPKETIEGKDFLNYLYYDKDGYILASNNYVLAALKCEFDSKKKELSEDKEGNIIKDNKYPLWQHLFRGKSFNSVDVDYDKLEHIIDINKEQIKKLPKSKHKLPPQACELIKFDNVYFRIKQFDKFVKIAKTIKANEFNYGANDDKMIAITKEGKAVIAPMVWNNKDVLDEEPIDYFTYEYKSPQKEKIKKVTKSKTKTNGKK